MEAASWIAIYAAIVATGAFALEVRRWFESGPKIYVNASPGMIILGGENSDDESGILLVTAYNRGDRNTTITHMIVFRYDNIVSRIKCKPVENFIIPHPQVSGPPIIPYELKAGAQWLGAARPRPDLIKDIENGEYWAGVQTTNRARPYLKHIPKRKSIDGALKGAKNI
ncbi:hypothetical protein [Xanthobacter autotrophicus]|uniref:hypothetical protein n=1 Tax=Xanthobacter autotrophicus TaxID=280 RepID=UPI003727B45E